MPTYYVDMETTGLTELTSKIITIQYAELERKLGKNENGEEIDYGFGWVLDSYRGKARTYHTGSTRGFKNVYQRYPDLDLGITILTNRSSGNPMNIANQVADILFNKI